MAAENRIQVVLSALAQIYSCPSCGTRLRFGDLDCPHCGHDLDEHLRRWAAYLVEKLEGQARQAES